MKRIGVVRFLGTNCDQDVFDAINGIKGLKPVWLWYEDEFNKDFIDGVVIPGGFSYGDYLRCGALASKMPVMDSVEKFSKFGGKVLGICNGFQVLCERGLLPGILMRNKEVNFIDTWLSLEALSKNNPWSLKGSYTMPVAHGEGRFYISKKGLKDLEANDQIWFKYKDNPNGSILSIAGVLNKEKNIAGLMPHPERAVAKWMGGDEGKFLLEKFL